VTYHDGGPLPGAIERGIAIPKRPASPHGEEPARLDLPEPLATGEDLAFVGELSTLPTDDVPAPVLVLFVQRARDGKEVIHQNGIGMTERLRDGRVAYRVTMKAPATAGTFDVVISSRRVEAVICRGVAHVRPPAAR